jgi:hypothetical protein
LGAVFAALFTTYGVLLLVRPSAFFKLHDFVNPGMRWDHAAAWRKDLHKAEWKAVGVMLMAFGLFAFMSLNPVTVLIAEALAR